MRIEKLAEKITHFPLDLPYSRAFSIRGLYCGMLAAERMSDGFVVASVGRKSLMAKIKISWNYF
jgi:hypothetical protein